MEPESPFTIRENHPAGATAALAAPLAIVIVWLANSLGANMPVEVGVAIAAVLTALPTMLVSWRTPRITIPDIPGAIEDRGIATGPIDLAETVPTETDRAQTVEQKQNKILKAQLEAQEPAYVDLTADPIETDEPDVDANAGM